MSIAIVLLVVSLALQQVTGAQQADQVPPFQTAVELVRIPVRVLDSKGRFVRNLVRDDFRVFEDGAPQPIATFDLIEPVATNAGSGQPTPRETEKAVAPSGSLSSMRTYVVLFDDYHLLPDEATKARSIATMFLREHTGIDDRVAVAFTSGASGQDLTSDRSWCFLPSSDCAGSSTRTRRAGSQK